MTCLREPTSFGGGYGMHAVITTRRFASHSLRIEQVGCCERTLKALTDSNIPLANGVDFVDEARQECLMIRRNAGNNSANQWWSRIHHLHNTG